MGVGKFATVSLKKKKIKIKCSKKFKSSLEISISYAAKAGEGGRDREIQLQGSPGGSQRWMGWYLQKLLKWEGKCCTQKRG